VPGPGWLVLRCLSSPASFRRREKSGRLGVWTCRSGQRLDSLDSGSGQSGQKVWTTSGQGSPFSSSGCEQRPLVPDRPWTLSALAAGLQALSWGHLLGCGPKRGGRQRILAPGLWLTPLSGSPEPWGLEGAMTSSRFTFGNSQTLAVRAWGLKGRTTLTTGTPATWRSRGMTPS
jgi:hypothetical protein